MIFQKALLSFYRYFEESKNEQIYLHNFEDQSPDALMGKLYKPNTIYEVSGRIRGVASGVVLQSVRYYRMMSYLCAYIMLFLCYSMMAWNATIIS